jgi:hypothetical protein
VVVAAYPLTLGRLLALAVDFGQHLQPTLTLGRLLALAVDFGQHLQPTPKAPDFRLVSQE